MFFKRHEEVVKFIFFEEMVNILPVHSSIFTNLWKQDLIFNDKPVQKEGVHQFQKILVAKMPQLQILEQMFPSPTQGHCLCLLMGISTELFPFHTDLSLTPRALLNHGTRHGAADGKALEKSSDWVTQAQSDEFLNQDT